MYGFNGSVLVLRDQGKWVDSLKQISGILQKVGISVLYEEKHHRLFYPEFILSSIVI